MRSFGVEEEYLLVDASSGSPVAVAGRLLHQNVVPATPAELTAELQEEMIESVTPPRLRLDDLRADIASAREAADTMATRIGARAVALAGSPLPAQPHTMNVPRYQEMLSRYGITARQSLTCGFHVHVSIQSREEGVGILDRIRDWLPLVIALTANSALRDGEDTGYASYRTVAWREWPTAGPVDVLGSLQAYEALEDAMLATGVPIDPGMLYFDARLSRNHPTVEIRVADVCLFQDDAVTVAGIIRALVETAAQQASDRVDPIATATTVLRLASWRAARDGLGSELVHPATGRLTTAKTAIYALIEHIEPALRATGDFEIVTSGTKRILSRGTGAAVQRAVLDNGGSFVKVVHEAIHLTHRSHL